MSKSITNNLFLTIAPLFGRTPDDSELEEVLGALGHLPFCGFGVDDFSLYLPNKADGFCLLFEDADTVDHKLAKGKARRTPVFTGCFFYPEGIDEYSQFKGPLPEGIVWSDTSESILGKLGKPQNEIMNKKTGKLKAHRWNLGAFLLTASYRKEGTSLHHVYVGIV